MGSTVHQSTKTTQWTVSGQSNQSTSQKVSNQPTCKNVNQDSYLITQLVISWLACGVMTPLILAILSVNESVSQSESKSVSLSVNQSWSYQSVSQ